MLARPHGHLALITQHGDVGTRRRILLEELLDPGRDRAGQRLLMRGAVQFLRLIDVGDEPGFHQDRRNIRRLQHHKARLFDTALVQRRDPPHVGKHLLPDVQAGGQRSGHRQVQQYPRQHAVLVIQADVASTTDQVRLVLAVGQPARGFRGGASIGEGKHRRAEGAATGRGVGMNRHEQIGAFLACDLGTFAQRNEIVASAHQLATEAFLATDLALQLLGNRQGHILLVLPLRA